MAQSDETEVIVDRAKIISYWGVPDVCRAIIFGESGDFNKTITAAEKAVEVLDSSDQKYWKNLAHLELGRAIGKTDFSLKEQAKYHITETIRIAEELKIKPQVA